MENENINQEKNSDKSEIGNKDQNNTKQSEETSAEQGQSGSSADSKADNLPESTSTDKDLEDVTDLLSAFSMIPSDPNKILLSTTLDGVAKYIKKHPNLKVITMVGAGISTAAGIPDFRSPKTGIYANLQKYNLPYTNAIFELNYFKKNPAPFYHLAGEIFPGTYKPTVAHCFIKLLQDKNLLLRHFSQNIDNLDRTVGINEDKLIEAHGTFHTSHCLDCRALYDLEWMSTKIKAKTIPKCSECEGLIKPDIVFFGEQLPRKFYENLSDFDECELLIIMGSSLAVEPFASLVTRVPPTCPRLLINSTSVGSNLGFRFQSTDNTKDVLWLGTCDDGCMFLAEQLGWKRELNKIIYSVRK